jgi:hypothetical protein
MIVILEGPDGGGKTVLAKLLEQKFGLRYHHEGPPPPGVHPLVHYGNLLASARRMDGGVVFDRLALGERVYGPIFRPDGGDRLGDDGWFVIQATTRALGAIQVLCLPPYEPCHATWAKRKEEGGEMYADRFREVYSAYTRFVQTQDYVYDWTKTDALDHAVKAVVDFE